MAHDSVGKAKLTPGLTSGVLTKKTREHPDETHSFVPSELTIKVALIESLQDFFAGDPEVPDEFRWYLETENIHTPGVTGIEIRDQFVDEEQYFPTVVVTSVSTSRVPVSLGEGHLYEREDDIGVWVGNGGRVTFQVSISVATTKAGEEEFLKDLVAFSLDEPVRKRMGHRGYDLVPNSVAPGGYNQRPIAGQTTVAYQADLRSTWTAMWVREYLVKAETIQSVSLTF